MLYALKGAHYLRMTKINVQSLWKFNLLFECFQKSELGMI